VFLSYCCILQAGMDGVVAIFKRLQLQEEIRELGYWKNDMNDKKSLRRREWRDLSVQAILNSAVIEVDTLLKEKLKLLHRHLREEISKSGTETAARIPALGDFEMSVD
jgi:hypothetical protein